MSKSPKSPGDAQGSRRTDRSEKLSSLRNPVGPKDRSVYVKRRIMVLLGFLAVVAVVVLVFLKPGSEGGAREASSVEVPADLPKNQAEATDEEPAVCGPEQLVVTPMTDQPGYGEGEQPQLSLTVENIGAAPCVADLGTAGITYTITSGEDEVWRSTDCQTEPTSMPIILDEGKPETVEGLAWVRERSDPETCDIAREQVAAGGASYHLSASAAGISSTQTAQFILH